MLVFNLMRWSSFFSNGISRVPPYSFQLGFNLFRLQDFHLLRLSFPTHSSIPYCHVADLGSSNFARHYFRNRFCFLFLFLLRYFNSEGFAHLSMYLTLLKCVPTFGFLRIVAYLQLPVAFRRSSRPSSPSCA